MSIRINEQNQIARTKGHFVRGNSDKSGYTCVRELSGQTDALSFFERTSMSSRLLINFKYGQRY